MKKRLLTSLLLLLMLISLIPGISAYALSTSEGIETAEDEFSKDVTEPVPLDEASLVTDVSENYMPKKAVAWAAANWNQDVGKGATFARKALRAGGISASTEIDLANEMLKYGYDQSRLTNTNCTFTKALTSSNWTNLKAGDILVVYCANCTTLGSKYVANNCQVVAGINTSKGTIHYYQRNTARDNTVGASNFYNSSTMASAWSCSCSSPSFKTAVIHFKHTCVWDGCTVTQYATCTTAGTKHYTCSGCGASKDESYGPLGHSYGTPSYTWNGYGQCTATRVCTNDSSHYETQTVNTTATVVQNRSCVNDEYTSYYAYFSNTAFATQSKTWIKTANATGHSFGAWTVTTAPTCTVKGEETRYCANCTAFETRDVDALGHNTVSHNAKAATCTEVGWNAYDTCTRCSYSTYVEIPATGHSFGAWTVTTAPSCTVKGEETRYCANCTAFETRDVDALGHNTVGHDAKAATCTEVGWNAYDTCTRCDYSTYVEIPATGHRHTAVVTKPGCTTQGYTTHTCACGDTYVDSYVDPLGHNFVKGVCTRCGAKLPTATLSILTPSTTTVKYGDTLILHAYVENMPNDAHIEWSVSGSGAQITPSADGSTCGVKCTGKGTVTVTAKLVYNDGTPVMGANGALSADQSLTMDGSCWNKFVSFFKDLFGVNRVTERSV